jgi:hypothetical protein
MLRWKRQGRWATPGGQFHCLNSPRSFRDGKSPEARLIGLEWHSGRHAVTLLDAHTAQQRCLPRFVALFRYQETPLLWQPQPERLPCIAHVAVQFHPLRLSSSASVASHLPKQWRHLWSSTFNRQPMAVSSEIFRLDLSIPLVFASGGTTSCAATNSSACPVKPCCHSLHTT